MTTIHPDNHKVSESAFLCNTTNRIVTWAPWLPFMFLNEANSEDHESIIVEFWNLECKWSMVWAKIKLIKSERALNQFHDQNLLATLSNF